MEKKTDDEIRAERTMNVATVETVPLKEHTYCAKKKK